ncbi:MAG: acetate kinase [Candidatus Omnitrophica bacterium]|nr:acetate kinase [Candidatus Omnitrophota bacterium]
MKVLVINCGSSSVKYQLLHTKTEKVVNKGIVERIKYFNGFMDAMVQIKNRLLTGENALKSLEEIAGIGHRVVHGGEEFSEAVIVNPNVVKRIEKYSELAPLHNPSALVGIKSCLEIFNNIPQVAVFDTAFHQTMPAKAYMYAIPYDYYRKYKVRRYGFHGTSHRFVAEKTAQILKKPLSELNLITLHLGNGASVAAIAKGKVVDTSMGFTPLEGLMMGTRSGDMDPAIVTFLIDKTGINYKTVNDILNQKSGLLGITGQSNDMRDIIELIGKKDERAILAYEMYIYRIKKYIGAYAAVLGKVDAVVFTAGIGEKMPKIKETMEKDLLELLGKNTKFMIVPTNEELLIAKDTYDVIRKMDEKQ